MVVTRQQVLNLLNTFETDYDTASELGIEVLPILETLVKEGDPIFSSKSYLLASLIPDVRSSSILMIALKVKYPKSVLQLPMVAAT